MTTKVCSTISAIPACPPPDIHPIVIEIERQPGRILIVDSDEQIRSLLCAVCEDASHPTDAVSCGAEARHLLKSHRDYALALVDLRLAGESGIELLWWIRSHRPEIAVILLTSVNDPAVVEIAFDFGACDCVVKPFNVNDLVSCVSNALALRSSPLSLLRPA
jgi:DNA-binding NtrC family response regulator